MQLQKVKYFIEVAKQGSFTKAAKTFYISQPALSKQIKLLEDELGFSLFVRTSRGLTLTEKGTALYQDMEPLFQRMEQLLYQHKHQDVLRFGSTPLLSSYFLHQYYHKFESMQFHVTAIEDDSRDLIPLLQRKDIDAAIVQDIESVPDLYSKKLFQDEFVAAVPTNLPIAQQTVLTMEDCLTFTQIIPPASGSPLHQRLREIYKAYHFQGDIVETHYQAMVGLVSLGIGVAYIPRVMAAQIDYKGVVFIPIEGSPLTRTMYLYATSAAKLAYLFNTFS
ncbi:LysR family transcriptional regulator [Pontibacillus salicampi]|uniref:LysR family transcriptional regulator n=1 Tax=Pontibacillus salicampi TaxID=1449801 RepID=A0ABV6LLV9_9BACI